MDIEESITSGPHSQLAGLAGEWAGVTKTWFEPDNLADESPMTGTIRSVLGGRFIVHEYAGSFGDKPFEGISIIGFDVATGMYQSAWIDSFHMSAAIMFSEGEDGGDGYNAAGTYFAGEGNPRWGWRTEINVVDDDNIVLTAYNVTPDGQEAKATETQYKRTS